MKTNKFKPQDFKVELIENKRKPIWMGEIIKSRHRSGAMCIKHYLIVIFVLLIILLAMCALEHRV